MKELKNNTFLRFLIVGVVNTLVGAGLMFVLFNFFNCSYWLSSVANYLVGGICSFVLNKFFTFSAKGFSWQEVIRFVLTVAMCYLIAYGGAKLAFLYLFAQLSPKLQGNLALALGMVCYTLLNYFVQKKWVFVKRDV